MGLEECNRFVGDLMNKLSNFKSTILNYPFPVLKINSEADEENVADIFVNINSGGTKLNQSDFILSLVSVHYPKGRGLIENFFRDTKYHKDNVREDICNPIISFEPADIIRVVMAYGFKRGRLKYGYKLLRGADLDKSELTNDFFNITLVDKLKSSSSQNPAFLTYIAAQNILGAKVLFSKPSITTVSSFDEWINGARKAVELHHLFPKNFRA